MPPRSRNRKPAADDRRPGRSLKQDFSSPSPSDQRLAGIYPSIARRLAAMVYEALIVTAILLGAAFLFVGAATGELHGGVRLTFQLYLLLILGAYFVWCWHKGRTLAMRAWKLRVVRPDGGPLSMWQALLRFVLAALTLGGGVVGAIALWKQHDLIGAWLAVGVGLFSLAWALLDRDDQFLHDRLAGTRLVLVKEPRKSKP